MSHLTLLDSLVESTPTVSIHELPRIKDICRETVVRYNISESGDSLPCGTWAFQTYTLRRYYY